MPDPRPLKFNAQGIAALGGWKPKTESADARVEEVKREGQPPMYGIACGASGHCVASWRTRVLLSAGRYKLTGKARTASVAASNDAPGAGAGLRISGGQRTNRLAGDSGWQMLEYEFEVPGAMQEVELVAELRATKGVVLFDASSLRLVQVTQ
jgi:hypothetical protein